MRNHIDYKAKNVLENRRKCIYKKYGRMEVGGEAVYECEMAA